MFNVFKLIEDLWDRIINRKPSISQSIEQQFSYFVQSLKEDMRTQMIILMQYRKPVKYLLKIFKGL